MSSCCLVPAKRVWRALRARLGLRRTTGCAGAAGLGRLRKEVRTCEYSDVHVMWEMLSKPTSTSGSAATTRRVRTVRKAAAWSRLASYCCAL